MHSIGTLKRLNAIRRANPTWRLSSDLRALTASIRALARRVGAIEGQLKAKKSKSKRTRRNG